MNNLDKKIRRTQRLVMGIWVVQFFIGLLVLGATAYGMWMLFTQPEAVHAWFMTLIKGEQ